MASGVTLVLCAVGLAYFGYRWTKPTPFPPNPQVCLKHIAGRCAGEQSGIYLYVSDPMIPVAVEAGYGQNIFGPRGVAESLQVGADVPAGQSIRWMIQLYGVTRLTPQTFGPGIGGKRRRIDLSPGVSLLTIKHWTPNSGTNVQVLLGEIRGPARGFSLMKTVAQNPVGYTVTGIESATGDTSGQIVTENQKYLLGDLPYVFAIGPNDVPGSPASAPGISDGNLLIAGNWFFPRRVFVQESYTTPLGAQVMYVEPQTSQAGRMEWQTNDYVDGRFGLSRPTAQADEQKHQFWAGIALGVAVEELRRAFELRRSANMTVPADVT